MKQPSFGFDDAAAWNAAEHGADIAADKADSIADGWKLSALESVRRYALDHGDSFVVDAVGLAVPDGADPRAVGHIMLTARRRGWIVSCGYSRTSKVSGHAGPRALWKSAIFQARAS